MARRLPPLNALKSFEAAARHLSFTRAAEELHVTHGAISRQVKSLEDYFQQPLFVRGKGKISLNAAGMRLFQMAETVLDEIESGAQQVLGQPDHDVLSINVTSAFAALWLMPRLGRFQSTHPDLTISLFPASKFDCQGFAEQAFDVAIRWEAAQSPGIEMDSLIPVDSFPACAPELLGPGLQKPADLTNQMLIHDDDGTAWRGWFAAAGMGEVDLSRGRFYSDSQLALQAAVEGQGVIAAGSVLAARELADGRLIIPFGPVIRARHTYCLYFPTHSRETDKIRAFRRWIEQEVVEYLEQRQDTERYLTQL